MGLTDVFSISTLICLGIMILLLGIASMFFMQRINDQNHKIGSMLGLVSTMAEELNFVRSRVQILSAGAFSQNGGSSPHVASSQVSSDPLIPVSDDENEEDDDTEGAEDESDDEDDASDDEDDDIEGTEDEDNDIEDEEEEERQNIKTINMGETLDVNFHCEALAVEEGEEEAASSNSELEDELESVDDENLEEGDLDNTETLTLTNTDFIKSIDISNLDESHKETETFDYKKMSLNKLRSVVVEKGLVTDSSKLKKNELLKLLSSE